MQGQAVLPRARAEGALYTKGEEIFNAVSHIVGGAFGLAVTVSLCARSGGDGARLASALVFGACILILYTMSALYHFLPEGRAKRVFRVFDHCTIFLLIAGTYTPYCLLALGGSAWGTGILAAQWLLAAFGIALNAAAMHRRAVKAISMVLYVVTGWMAALAFRPLYAALSLLGFGMLVGGGIAYTVGIVFYACGKKVRYLHSVWHLFVLAGTALQYVSILAMYP